MARILRYAASLEFASIAGALAGAALVLAHLVEDEYLFGTYATLRWAAVGWLAGFAVAFAIGRAVRHLRGQSTAPVARWRRALLIVITLLAFLAVLPWLRVTLSGGLQIIARKTGIVSGSTHPNLILITIDALRADHLG
ncbi:MAG: hypothetical protein GTO55_09230, partial [Armatimonadetes bacterium]|nr:hypothetical protein [Armatimonadota bacterium]NIM24429.1 hypothetical protein [Armatimonadota bacterium]NIM68300.1 hypothetical protein [Armatimonadota bacterium]NIM76704.1 hypothetical protein [Armatimonadota bacterium]NIN06503.1 hypothetical protein [Armatimonadota bacterium]